MIAFVSVYLSKVIIGGLEYGELFSSSHLTFIAALTVAQLIIFPMLRILSLPTKGFSGLFLRSLLVGLIFYMSTSALPNFAITSTYLPEVKIMDVTLPSKNLGPIETLVAISLCYSIISSFLIWLYKGKR